MEKIQIKSLIFALTYILIFYGCSQSIKTPKYESPKVETGKDIDENPSRLNEITDIPIPSKSAIDLEKTFILGKGDEWMGRLTLINKKNVEDIYSFFSSEMPKFSFKEKSTIRSDVSTLIYENKKKAIFIKISKLNFGKSYIEITATPVN